MDEPRKRFYLPPFRSEKVSLLLLLLGIEFLSRWRDCEDLAPASGARELILSATTELDLLDVLHWARGHISPVTAYNFEKS